MFLLPSLVIGLALALVLGGKPSRLAAVRFSLPWTVLLALAMQLVLFSHLGAGIPDTVRGPLHVATYGLLLIFAVANVRLLPLIPVLLGVGLNSLAIAVNGGVMPVTTTAARAAGIEPLQGANVSSHADHLRFLGDVFALPKQLPIANTFSVGDLLIGFGMIAFIVIVSLPRGGADTLSASRMIEPLRIRAYRRLAAGKLLSSIGDWLTVSALIGWIYHETGSTGNVAILLLVRLAPPILGGGLAAVVVDRLPKNRVLVLVELLRGLAVGGALLSILAGNDLGVFVALGFSGALAAISSAAGSALLPSLVPTEQLPSANAALGLAKDGAMALGAVAAGVALSYLGVAVALGADLVTFVLAMALFTALPRGVVHASEDDEKRERFSGLRYVFRRRALLFLIVSFCAATLATGLTNATLPRFLEGDLGFGPGGYGFGIAALGTGLALGQALVGLTRIGPTAGRWIGVGLFVMASLFVFLGLTHHAPTALLVIGLIGFVDGTTDVLFETVLQREADPRHYGAVFGVAGACIMTTILGAVSLAPLANDLFSPHGVILGTSIFLVAAGAIALLGMARGSEEAEVPRERQTTRVVRTGDDLSLITSEALLDLAGATALELAGDYSVEIVVAPAFDDWDAGVIWASIEKTSKALVLHDNSGNELLAAELAATIADECFENLDGPVRRVCSPDDDVTVKVRDLAEF
jgi:predicted MFS family arabinose efflux permease